MRRKRKHPAILARVFFRGSIPATLFESGNKIALKFLFISAINKRLRSNGYRNPFVIVWFSPESMD